MIVLQIPSGEDCEGCMFNGSDIWGDYAQCRLFKEPLRVERSYGEVMGVYKCASCPREDELK